MTDLPSEIKSLTDEQVSKLRKETTQVIDKVVDRIHYAESRRGNFGTIGTASVAAGLTILTFALSQSIRFEFWVSTIVFGSLLLVFGLSIWVMFSLQTNRYPFTAATQAWKWHYRDALPNNTAFDLPWYSYLMPWKRLRTRVQSEYAKQLPIFYKTHLLPLSDERLALWQDVQQLYILHINEKYKNLFLNHFRSFVPIAFVSATVLAVLSYFIAHQMHPAQFHQSRIENTNFVIEARWADIGAPISDPVAESRELLVNITLTNKQPTEIPVGEIYAVTANGLHIPLKIITIGGSKGNAGLGCCYSIIATVFTESRLADRVERFGVEPE